MFADSWEQGRVEVAFTDRLGGVSAPPYTSLNLAAEGGDERSAVAENLSRVMEAFAGSADASAALMRQVHGSDVAVVDRDPGPAVAGVEGLPRVDGLVTALADVTLVVRVADCVPVVVADVERGVVAALHAGRPGLVAGIVPAGIDALRRLGAEQLVAWVGPHVCGRCYEVPEPMRADVAEVVPEAWAETSWSTPAVDVGAGVVAQLHAAGAEVVDASRCTREEQDLFSYRRDGAGAGRMAGLVRVRG
ncbi:MAG TPA: polyphenol oxidase family protein [Marmoricola sp.]|nr:polyphenol oxidase family protein [Marmoricola sp.]